MLGQKIQKLRKEKGLSQEDLAEALGISRQAVSKWETGNSYPDTENLIAISALLGCDISALVEDKPQEGNQAEDAVKTHRLPVSAFCAVLAIVVALVFLFMWQVDARREVKLERLCQAGASGCLDSLLSYEKTGEESHYLSAVSEFRTFMLSYHLLTEDDSGHGNCTYLNEAYGYMLCSRDILNQNLDTLIGAMQHLSSDIYSYEGHNEMYALYIALRHG